MDIFQFWNVYRTVRKNDFVFLARVRVSSQYFPVLDCISYSCARKRSWISLWLGLAVDIFQFWNIYRTVRKKELFLARVRVSSPYFPVLDCISYSCARKRSWVSLWLELAVDIFQFWNAYHTVRKNDFVFLARVRVSSQYFPVLDCILYSCARKGPLRSLWLGLAVDIFQFWNVYRTVRKADLFLTRVRVSSPYFPVLDCMSYSCARKRSWVSLWLGLAVDIFQFLNVYCTVHKKDFVFIARVRVSSQDFPVLDCILYSCAIKRSWLSLWLGLEVECISYIMQEGLISL